MPAVNGTFGHPPLGGALTAEPGSPVAEWLTPHTSAAATPSTEVAAPPASTPSTDVSSVGIGVALTVLLGMVAVLVRRRRPSRPPAPVDYPDIPEVR